MILSLNGIIAGRGVIPSTLSNGLVSVYKAESNANDSLSTYNGTAQGGLTYTTGKSGQSFNLNGTNSYIDVSDSFDLGINSFSFSAWINPTYTSFNHTIFTKMSYNSTIGNYDFLITSGLLQFYLVLDSTNYIILKANTPTITVDVWSHVVVVVDRFDKIKIYLNGSMLTSVSDIGTYSNNNLSTYSTSNFNTNNPFRIGCSNGADLINPINPSRFFQGKIDEFNVWNRVLTPTEITELYNSGTGKFYPY